MSSVVIHTDGGARGNPGPAAAAAVVSQNGTVIAEVRKYLGDSCTNNFAEYQGLALGLMETQRLGLTQEPIEVRMDSELVVKQMRGQYKVKDAALKVEHATVRALLQQFANVRFTHVPREQNKEADKLVNEAIDAASR